MTVKHTTISSEQREAGGQDVNVITNNVQRNNTND